MLLLIKVFESSRHIGACVSCRHLLRTALLSGAVNVARVYFPGLHGLRFFAALAVVFTHVELMKKYMGFHHLWMDSGQRISSFAAAHISHGDFHWASPLVAEAGPLGVVFFFVLSGFLITYLLLVEKQQGRVHIGRFYLRRILRIWPLYYLVFLLGFFVLPHFEWFHVPVQSEAFIQNYWGNFWCYALFVPNLAYSLYMAVPNIGQLWSIGVEEQFYILWPLLIGLSKKPLRIILVFTALLLAIKAAFIIGTSHMNTPSVLALKKLLAMSKIECMSLGGLGAYALHSGWSKVLAAVLTPQAQWLSLLAIPVLLYFTPAFLQDGVHLLFGAAFLVIIINAAGNPQSLIKPENKVFRMLGNISYGIYMYHLMCVVWVLHLLRSIGFAGKDLGLQGNVLAYTFSVGLSIVVAYLSYRYFESPFVKMKKKITTVLSGDEAR